MTKRSFLFSAVLFLLFLFGGCGSKYTMTELLSLPKLSEEYIELQNALDKLLSEGAGFCAPLSGSHRQSVQFYDVNGDGTDEALAFLRSAGERPLSIHILIQEDGKFISAAVIDGAGTGIDSVTYLDMDGDGWAEIIVGWSMGSDIKMLSVYSLKSFQVSPVINCDYTQYAVADLTADGRQELITLRTAGADKGGTAELYEIALDGEPVSATARLSLGLEGISHISTGSLTDGVNALFVEGSIQNNLITDILVYSDGILKNISISAESGISDSTLRSSVVSCRDMTYDGIMEVPRPRALHSQGETVYRVLDWYSYSSRGEASLQLTTYHNFSDSWFLVLMPEWMESITIRREDGMNGERAVVFSRWLNDESSVEDFLTVYTISGENRDELSRRNGLFILYRGVDLIVAAELKQSSWEYSPDIPYILNHFSLIYSDWVSGLQ